MGDTGVSPGFLSQFTIPAVFGSDFYLALLTADPELDFDGVDSSADGSDVKPYAFVGLDPVHANDWGISFTDGYSIQRISNNNDIVFDAIAGGPGSQTATHVAWMSNGFYSAAPVPTGDWSNINVMAVTLLARQLTYTNGMAPEIPAGQATLDFVAVRPT